MVTYEDRVNNADIVREACKNNGLNEHQTEEVLKIVEQESKFDNTIVNQSSGAAGLGQFLENTWKGWPLGNGQRGDGYGKNTDGTFKDIFDPQANADATVRYYKDCYNYAKNNPKEGISQDERTYQYYHDGKNEVDAGRDHGGLNNYRNGVNKKDGVPDLSYKPKPGTKSGGGAMPGSGRSGGGIGSGSGWGVSPGSSGPSWGPTGPGGGVGGANRIIVSHDPLLIDLNGDGIETISSTEGVYFDYNGDGFAERMGWASSDDGVLVLDRNNDGVINDGSELFGDQTILSTGKKAANGFQALADLDSNADGKIDINDAAYSQLRIWRDTDNDGYSLEGELFTLGELGIESINLTTTATNVTDANGNTQTLTGSFAKTDGTTGQIANYNLHTDTIYTIPENWVEVPEDIYALPDLQGYGNVYDLHQAVAMDTTGDLKALVEQFIAETNPANRKDIMEQILFHWTDSADITQNRGSMDGRQLATLEKFSGQNFVGMWSPDDPSSFAVDVLTQAYQNLLETSYCHLMVQTHLQDLYDKITYTWDETMQTAKADLSAVITELQTRLINDPEQGKQDLGEFARSLRGVGIQEMVNYVSFRETFISMDAALGWIIDSAGCNMVNYPYSDWSGEYWGTNLSDAFQASLVLGNGIFNGNNGNDAIYGTSRDETFSNAAGNSTIVAGGGNDVIWAGAGDDLLDGGTGNDALYGQAGNDTYIFRRGDGRDTIIDSDSTAGNVDTIFIGSDIAPEDVVVKRSGNNLVLWLKDTTDAITVQGYYQSNSTQYRIERIQFADGTAWYAADIEQQKIIAQVTEGDDVIYGTEQDDVLSGLQGNDVIYGNGGNDSLSGNEDNDTLYGGVGNESLDGGSGNDVLYGGAGDDVLIGGTGNDTLYGETGDDTYVFGCGAGQDTIIDYGTTQGNLDKILLSSDITPADVTLRRNGDSLILSINETNDAVTINNWFLNESTQYQVEQIQFADGTVWDVDTIKQMVLQGSTGDDVLIGYSAADNIQGLDGNDQLYGLTGDDTLGGGLGDDLIYGESGNDFLTGDEGNDIFYGGAGNDSLDGGAGEDTLYGGTEMDYYYQNSNGYDTYLFGRGSGRDVVIDYDKTQGNLDAILLDSGISPDDIVLRRNNDNLELYIVGSEDKLTVYGWFYDSGAFQVEQIRFADGTVWDASIISQMLYQGSPGNDLIVGSSKDDVFNGKGGDDQLYGRAGNDMLDGGTGDDQLYGEADNDILVGNEGNDILYGGTGNDILDGGAGDDTLYGGDGTDYYRNKGNNSNGNDTYLFGPGSGNDTIIDYDTTQGNLDTILLNSDVTPADVMVRRAGDNLVLSINDTGDTVTVNKWFLNESSDYQVEQIQFIDGTIWDVAAIRQMVLQGTAGDDVLIGYSAADSIQGLDGNDQLYGRAGDDTLNGNAGNDTLYGEVGNDTYLFGRGSGNDTIIDYDSTQENLDTILLNSDVTPADVTLRRSGNSLIISINDTGDTVTVNNWFLNDSTEYQVEQIQFNDGTVWDVPTIQQMVLQGTTDDDLLIGYSTADTFDGKEGNDQLYGRAGNDTIDGGAGYDTLYGETGNDTYLFGRGSGQDVVIDYDTTQGNLDTILLNADITPADVTLMRNYDDLVLFINDTGDAVAVSNWFLNESSDYQVEQIQFTDGTTWDVAAIRQMVLQGTAWDDVLRGYNNSDDVINGNAGDDTLIGETGNDTYIFGRGFGKDKIIDVDDTPGNIDTIQLTPDVLPEDVALTWGAEGLYLSINDTDDSLLLTNWFVSDRYKIERIQFADGTIWDTAMMQSITSAPTYTEDQLTGTFLDDILIGNSTADFIQGGEGNDDLYGGDGNDIITGGAGIDILYGGAGDDILDGGDGINYLYGGTGNDTYMFGYGVSMDFIVDYDETPGNVDTILLNADVTPAVVTLARSSNDLILMLNSSGERLKVDNWFLNDSSEYQIEQIKFADSTVWDTQTIKQIVLNSGGVVSGYSTADNINGSAGGDILFGRAGDDVIDGGLGADYIDGGEGNDTLIAGGSWVDQTDKVYGGEGNDLISFGYDGYGKGIFDGGSGNDYLTGGSWNDTIFGGTGNDTLDGGGGENILIGGTGNDVYIFNNAAFANDYVFDYDQEAGNADTIYVNDLSPYDVTLFKCDDDLVLVSAINGQSVMKVGDWFLNDAYKVENIEFSDGTVWDVSYINQNVSDTGSSHSHTPGSVTGTENDDELYGIAGDDLIEGLDGNDLLYGGSYPYKNSRYNSELEVDYYDGNDTLLGGNGNDTLYGGWGNDVIDGGAGDDKLYGGDYFRGRYWWDETDLTNDNNGNDTYLFERGSGNDIIYDRDATPGNIDTIIFGSDISPDDITLSRGFYEYGGPNDDLVLSIAGSTDTLTIYNWADSSGEWKIESIQFADGTVWTLPTINQMFLESQSTTGNDFIRGDSYTDNVLDGGAGNDMLIGGKGNDTYIFGRGYGQDIIFDEGGIPGDVDTVVLKDLLPSDIILQRQQDPSLSVPSTNLELSIAGTDDTLTMYYWFDDDWYAASGYDLGACKIERIQFADGTIWDSNTIENILNTPTAGNDYLVGTIANDAIYGGAGDDTIAGIHGEDTIYGGTGNDNLTGGDMTYSFSGHNLLVGGDGNDTLNSANNINILDGGSGDDNLNGCKGFNSFIMNCGSGFDSIETSVGYDVPGSGNIFFGTGITPDDLSVQIGTKVVVDEWGNTTETLLLAIGIGNNEGVLINASPDNGGEPELMSASSLGESAGGNLSSSNFAEIPIKYFMFTDIEALPVEEILQLTIGGGVYADYYGVNYLTLDQILALADNGVIGEQYGTDENDFLRGSVTDDTIYGGDGNDKIDARDRNDYVEGGSGNDVISGGAGNDSIYSGAGDDIMAGGKGDDVFIDENGEAVYAFNRGDGLDYIYAEGSEILTISFGLSINPDDIGVYSNDGHMALKVIGSEDEVTIDWYESSGIARIQFIAEDGTARIFDLISITQYLENNYYPELSTATANNPFPLFPDGTNSFEITGSVEIAGGVYAIAYAQTDDLFKAPTYFTGGPSDDIINGGVGDDIINAGDGNNIVDAGDGNNKVITGTGDDQITTGKGNDYINAGSGNNVIYSGSGDDVIYAGQGYDFIDAGAGDDTLVGGGGPNYLIGGTGNDTYHYDKGDGIIGIDDLADASDGNRIVFGAGIMPDDLSLNIIDGYLVINVAGNTDKIYLTNFDPNDVYGAHAVEDYEFSNGQVLSYSQLMDKGFSISGTVGEDLLIGTSGRDSIEGFGGDDVLAGGRGDDVLNGGSGNDIYVFNLGDGVDNVDDMAYPGGGNIVQFGDGISIADLKISAEQNELIVQVGNSNDQLRLTGLNPNDVYGNHAIETFQFADGSVISYSELVDYGFTFAGTAGDDALNGTDGNDIFKGNRGNDNLSGGIGDDTYVFNPADGVDSIDDEASIEQPNTLIFGTGISLADIKLSYDLDNGELVINIGDNGDTIHLKNFDAADPYGTHAVEYFRFSDGQTITYSQLIDRGFDIVGTAYADDLIGTNAADRIVGGADDDTLMGNVGNDTMIGGEGNDTYIFNVGDGVDVIDDVATASAGNTLIFGEGITLADIRNSLSFEDDVFVIRIGNGGDEVHLDGFDPNAADASPHAVDTFIFDDGTVVNFAELIQNTFVVQGNYEDNYISGTNMTDRLYGYYGFDTLDGGKGDDVLTGGPGDDTLIGGSGNDTYVFNIGDGVDTIQDSSSSTEFNHILFGTGITKSDLTFSQTDNVLTINVGDGGDAIRLLNFDYNGVSGSQVVTALEFADGSQVLLTDLLYSEPGTEGDDVINTGPEDDVINAKGGNDIINSDGGNDFIDGGNGYDIINSGDGNDTLLGGADNDILNGGAGADIMQGGSGNDTYMVDNIDDVVIENAYEGRDTVQSSISYHLGVNVEYLTLTGNEQISGTGNELNNVIIGNSAANVIDGGIGSDRMIGNAGDDIYIIDETGDVVIENANEGTDTVQSSIGYALGCNVENLTLIGSTAVIGSGNDLSNVIIGNTAANILAGGKGNDELIGNAGNDTYVFNIGDGSDTIIDISTIDEGNLISFGEGITVNNLVFVKNGTTLTIDVGSSGDSISLLNFDQNEIAGSLVVRTLQFADGNQVNLADFLNRPPVVANPVADQSTLEDEVFSFTVQENTFKDPDIGDSLRYSATMPEWLTFDSITRTFGGTPTNNNVGTQTVTVTATDASGASVTDSFDITVTNVNDAPEVANAIVNTGATEDEYFSFTIPENTFSDQDSGDTLSYSATIPEGATWLSFDSATRTFSGTPTNDDVGTISVKVTATDLTGVNVSDEFDLTVDNVNDEPTVTNPIADETATEDSAFNFTVPANTFNDVDAGDNLTFSAIMPSWLSFNPTTRTFSGTPTNDNVGIQIVTVTTTDTSGASVTDSFNLTVINVNDVPKVSNPLENQFATEDQPFTLTVPADTFKEIDVGDSLTYSATMPGWLTFDAVTSTFSGTPTNDNVGTQSVTVTATDTSGASVTDSFDITVNNVNDAPTLANPIQNQMATEDSPFSFIMPANIFNDVDSGDSRTYTATLSNGSALPAWLTFNGTTGTFSGTPNNDNVGTLSIKVTATDLAGASVSDEFNLTVNNVNDAPTVANPIINQTAMEDVAFNFTVPGNTFDDVDAGDSLTYSATMPGWLTFDAATRTFSGTPINDNVGTQTVTVTATDTSGAGVSDSFDITVSNVNDAPIVANPITNQSATEDAAFSFTIPANTFSDVDLGDSLTYGATLADGSALPSWIGFDAVTRTFSGTPANENVGNLSVNVTATDISGASVSANFNITVINVNDAPVVANPVTDQTINKCAPYSYTIPGNTFSDIDIGDTLIYSATLANGSALPSWLSFNSTTRTFSGTPTSTGKISVKVTATDSSNASVSSSFNLDVRRITYGTNYWDFLVTGCDDDLIYVLNGIDTVYSGNGDDIIYGGNDSDYLFGEGGNDIIYGESGNDYLDGGSGNDTLNGGSGADMMIGGSGDDTFVVDSTDDSVIEYPFQGTDTVQSSVTYSLDNNVENLALTGSNAINGTGNNLNNVLTGNNAVNTLIGNSGNDTLDGAHGNDILSGGNGSDTYLFRRTDGKDTINETAGISSDTDTLKLTDGITTTEPVLVKQGNDLYVFIDSNNYMKIASEFQATNYGIERLEVSDGHYITRSDIQTIVDTMSYINNDSGMDVMQKYNAMMNDQQYQNILATSWHQ